MYKPALLFFILFLIDSSAALAQNCSYWFPAPSTVCSGVQYRQENACDRSRFAVGTKNCCTASSWSPSTGSKCLGTSFTQTSNCGTRRSATGTNNPNNYSPYPNTKCNGQYYTARNSCNRVKTLRGTKVPNDYSPARSTVCYGKNFTARNSCNHAKTLSGTKQPSDYGPAQSTVCSGTNFTQTNSCGQKRTRPGTKSCCDSSSWTPATTSVCSGQSFQQTNGCGTTRNATGTKAVGGFSPSKDTICAGETFTQTRQCGSSQTATGTKTSGQCCTDTEWLPATNLATICQGSSITQTSNCGRERVVNGTALADSFSPAADTACEGENVTQTNLCGDVRTVEGTNKFGLECGTNLGTSNGLISRLSKTEPVTSFTQTLTDGRYGSERFAVEISGPGLENERAHPIFLRTEAEFTAFRNVMAPNSAANNPQPDDDIVYCLRTNKDPILGAWVDDGPKSTVCGSHTMTQTRSCTFDTVGEDQPLCDECENVTVSRTRTFTNNASGGSWLPSTDSFCEGDAFVQTLTGGTCTDTRNATGTGRPNNWSPGRSTVCDGQPITQTNSCNQTRRTTGTLNAGPWLPLESGWCPDESRLQANACASRQQVGTKTTGCGSTGGNNGSSCTDAPAPGQNATPPLAGWVFVRYTTENVGSNGASTLHWVSDPCGTITQSQYLCTGTNIGTYGCRAGDR